MRARICLIGVLILTMAYPLIAAANHRNVTDRNDTRGLLDVRRVKTSGKTRFPGYKIITFSRWSPAAIWDYGTFLVNFDTKGSSRPDYYALLRSNGSSMKGSLWRDRKNKADTRRAYLKVWRKTSNSVSLRVPIRRMKLGKSRFFYAWFAQSLYSSNSCPRVCFDRVPNKGRVRESNGRPQPTPTPTPTATPSPTVTPTPSP